MDHTYYFFAAYFVFWIATLFYLFTIWKRQTDIKKRLDQWMQDKESSTS